MGKKEEKQKAYVFIRDPDYGWRPAVLEDTRGDQAIVSVPEFKDEQSMMCGAGTTQKGEQGTVNLKDYTANVLPLANVDHNGNIQEFADMVKLPYLHEVRRCSKEVSDVCGSGSKLQPFTQVVEKLTSFLAAAFPFVLS